MFRDQAIRSSMYNESVFFFFFCDWTRTSVYELPTYPEFRDQVKRSLGTPRAICKNNKVFRRRPTGSMLQ